MSKKESRKDDLLMPETVIADRRRQLMLKADIVSFASRLAAMVLVLFLLFGIVFGIMPMPNDDMMPRLSAGDLMLIYRLEKEPHIQDVIVFEKNGKRYVGRVIAQESDVVEITEDAVLKINENVINEAEIYYPTPPYESDVNYPLAIGKDEYFILCDYREGAKDSRYFGTVHKHEIVGQIITVIRRSHL